MLLHPVIENLKKLRLQGMIEALESQSTDQQVEELRFEERLALLVDRELVLRENRRLKTRLRKANLKQNACFQDIDYRRSRGLDKSVIISLENCTWVQKGRNILIVGPTGTGKTFLGEAFSHNACLKGFSAHHLRLPRFFSELMVAKADGCYLKYMSELYKYDVLLVDDLGVVPMTPEQSRELLEIVDERFQKKSTIITSQLPVKHWHEAIGDKTLADAILDRIVHNSYRIELSGESMRKLLKPANEKNAETEVVS